MTSRMLALVVMFIGSTGVVDAARRVTIPEGTALRVRLDTTVASNTSRVEDQVYGRLVNPIVINGRTVVPAGSRVVGTVVNADRSDRVKGRASLALRFNELTPAPATTIATASGPPHGADGPKPRRARTR